MKTFELYKSQGQNCVYIHGIPYQPFTMYTALFLTKKRDSKSPETFFMSLNEENILINTINRIESVNCAHLVVYVSTARLYSICCYATVMDICLFKSTNRSRLG